MKKINISKSRRAEINGLAALGQSAEDSGAAAGSESNFVKNHSYWTGLLTFICIEFVVFFNLS